MRELPFGRWPDLDRLFERLLDVPGSERSRFLDRNCPDPAMREELRALLGAEERSRHVFQPLDRFSPSSAEADQDEGRRPILERVGPYRLVREIGRGGAATVFEAERADGLFDQRVALKLLHPEVTGEVAFDRLLQERHILATLRHPNIAHLLDGGVTEDGRPYIVMELIEGERIDRYCDRKRLTIEDRMRLCRAVCEAVHHAHQQLIVHRDIKPSNVLVTWDGEVKLVDFGIAKLLDSSALSRPAVETQTGLLLMTPAYASPEQVLGLEVTTRTDIYQIGELAFELVTGYRLRDAQQPSLSELLSQSRLEPRPLHKVVRTGQTVTSRTGDSTPDVPVEEIARRRRTDAGRLVRSLRGDVDRIVRTALRSGSGRRYSSAQQLADDLGRYLGGFPVWARDATLGYRMERLARRHPWGTIATASAAGVVVLLVGQLYGQFRSTVQERARAEAVIEFMTGLFDVADPRGGVGDTVTVRAILDTGAERVSRQLTDEPLVAATMRDAIGRAYEGLGRYDEARTLMRQALETRATELPSNAPELAASQLALARVAVFSRDLDEGLGLHEEALATHIRAHGRNSPETAMAMASLAWTLQGMGRRIEARAMYEGAIAIFEGQADRHEEVSVAAAEAMVGLSWILIEQGELSAARGRLSTALAIQKAARGLDHPAVANTLMGFFQLARSEEAWDSAAGLAQEVHRIRVDHFGRDHPSVGDALATQAQVAHGSGDLAAADRLYRAAVESLTSSLGPDAVDVGLALNNLGTVLRSMSRFADAETVARQARDAYGRALGPGHPFTAIAAHNLAAALEPLGRSEEAESLYRGAIASMASHWPDDHPRIALTRAALGSLLADSGAFDEGEAYLRTALAVLEGSLEPTDWRLGLALSSLGVCLAGQGLDFAADSLLTTGHEIVAGSLDPTRSEVHLTTERLERFQVSRSR